MCTSRKLPCVRVCSCAINTFLTPSYFLKGCKTCQNTWRCDWCVVRFSNAELFANISSACLQRPPPNHCRETRSLFYTTWLSTRYCNHRAKSHVIQKNRCFWVEIGSTWSRHACCRVPLIRNLGWNPEWVWLHRSPERHQYVDAHGTMWSLRVSWRYNSVGDNSREF